MSYRHCAFLTVALLWSITAGSALGQGISTETKTAATISPEQEKQIEAAVRDAISKLNDKEPQTVRNARETLIHGGRGGVTPASPAYRAKYGEILNREILPLIQTSRDVRAKLNGAIAVARVADLVNNAELEGAALALLDTRQPEFVQIWGVKAARPILAELTAKKAHQKLLNGVMSAVRQRPSAAMIQEAYDAFTPHTPDGKVASPQVVAVIASPLLTLLELRISIYGTGAVPEDPAAELRPVNYLVQQSVWNQALTPEQQQAAMQQMRSLLVLAANRGDQGDLRANELKSVVIGVLGGVAVVAELMNEAELASAAKDVIRECQPAGAKLLEHVQPLGDSIRKVKAFEGIKDPTLPAASPLAKP